MPEAIDGLFYGKMTYSLLGYCFEIVYISALINDVKKFVYSIDKQRLFEYLLKVKS